MENNANGKNVTPEMKALLRLLTDALLDTAGEMQKYSDPRLLLAFSLAKSAFLSNPFEGEAEFLLQAKEIYRATRAYNQNLEKAIDIVAKDVEEYKAEKEKVSAEIGVNVFSSSVAQG